MNEYKIYIDLDKIDWDTDGSPHNPLAAAMFSEITWNHWDKLVEDVSELKKKKLVSKISNDIRITFSIKDNHVRTEYTLQNGKKVVDIELYRSIRTNNEPDQELLLAIARAEINAQMAESADNFELHNFAAVVFYMTKAESYKPKNLLRTFLKTKGFWFIRRKL